MGQEGCQEHRARSLQLCLPLVQSVLDSKSLKSRPCRLGHLKPGIQTLSRIMEPESRAGRWEQLVDFDLSFCDSGL